MSDATVPSDRDNIVFIQEFCHRLKTVKVDVDSSGKKCKERMMKVLVGIPSSSTFRNRYASKR